MLLPLQSKVLNRLKSVATIVSFDKICMYVVHSLAISVTYQSTTRKMFASCNVRDARLLY